MKIYKTISLSSVLTQHWLWTRTLSEMETEHTAAATENLIVRVKCCVTLVMTFQTD